MIVGGSLRCRAEQADPVGRLLDIEVVSRRAGSLLFPLSWQFWGCLGGRSHHLHPGSSGTGAGRTAQRGRLGKDLGKLEPVVLTSLIVDVGEECVLEVVVNACRHPAWCRVAVALVSFRDSFRETYRSPLELWARALGPDWR